MDDINISGGENKARAVLLLFVVIVLVAAGVYLAGKNPSPGPQDQVLKQPSPFVPAPEYFRLSFSPQQVLVKRGAKADVKVSVTPLLGLNEPLVFKVEDVLQGITSVKSQNIVQAGFMKSTLLPGEFSKGLVLSISAAPIANKGFYVISFSISSSKVKRVFVLPVSME